MGARLAHWLSAIIIGNCCGCLAVSQHAKFEPLTDFIIAESMVNLLFIHQFVSAQNISFKSRSCSLQTLDRNTNSGTTVPLLFIKASQVAVKGAFLMHATQWHIVLWPNLCIDISSLQQFLPWTFLHFYLFMLTSHFYAETAVSSHVLRDTIVSCCVTFFCLQFSKFSTRSVDFSFYTSLLLLKVALNNKNPLPACLQRKGQILEDVDELSSKPLHVHERSEF